MTQLDRAELTSLVSRLLAGDYSDGDELERDANELRDAVAHPEVLGLIYYPDRYFDHEPTADEIVERVLAYRAIPL